MFTKIQGLLNSLFNDIQTTFLTLFAITLMISAIVWAFGDEHTSAGAKKWFVRILIALIVFLLAMSIVTYVRSKL